FGLLPLVRFFSVVDLETAMTEAGFEIIHQWQPEGDRAVFMVARKPAK
ncbi:MAG: SAM-dependent methyltransferase, partial [Alphaproteobacteria bacterium]|nr:SAM-dependent methyltransferase [Alphaproteobacteria bacterium]